MRKKYLAILIISLAAAKGECQFYYSDIILNKIANTNYVTLKNNKVKKVSISNGSKGAEEQEGLRVFETFSDNWGMLKTETNLQSGISTFSTTYYKNDKVWQKWDDGKNVNSLVRYTYDESGKLLSIISSSIDTTVLDGFFESHIFNYDNKGSLTKMYKLKNETDTTTIVFLKDEQGNIAEERWQRKGKTFENYYYYYNEKNQLTDIVKFNLKAQKMLPEFLFEYDEKGNVNKMTQIPFGNSSYFVWHYVFDDKGLKLGEFCYSKKGDLLGKVEYNYE